MRDIARVLPGINFCPLSPQSEEYMNAQARRRGMTREQLERRIIALVAVDRLVNAVLDDDELVLMARRYGGEPT